MGTFAVNVWTGAAYPARPSADVVRYIGPDEPTDWVDEDEWRKTDVPAATTGERLAAAAKTSSQTAIGTSETDVTSLSISVTNTAGRRVRIQTLCRVVAKTSSGTSAHTRALVRLYRDATLIGVVADISGFATSAAGLNLACGGWAYDEPGAGTFTYKLVALAVGTGATMDFEASATGPARIAAYDDGPV